LEIKIEDEQLNTNPMTTSSNPYGNINFGTNSTLNNFIETPTNEMLINNN
jgi:hypothetical protein